MNAKALVAYDKHKVELRELAIGEPGEWDLVVELETAGLSIGTESYIIASVDPAQPRVVGYAPVGRVTAVGERAAAERLLRLAPAVPLAAPGRDCTERYADDESRRVIGPRTLGDLIGRRAVTPRLRPFLQRRLGIAPADRPPPLPVSQRYPISRPK